MHFLGRHYIRLFKALGIEPRARIVTLLAEGRFCAGALARHLGISAGAVSQHLNVLKEAGLIVAERRGNFMHYSLTPDAYEKAREALDVLFGGQPPDANNGGRHRLTCFCPVHNDTSKGRYADKREKRNS
ncbi:MAG: helix-turn-helix transcriptional regulator [Chitinispirillaceae bacterium]|nr:helix-turn-helix transcriptional regulator [Chitinispirillaceae bacterium]